MSNCLSKVRYVQFVDIPQQANYNKLSNLQFDGSWMVLVYQGGCDVTHSFYWIQGGDKVLSASVSETFLPANICHIGGSVDF